MAFWQNRALDEVYATIFIGAIGVTLDGERGFLGLCAGTGGEGAKFTDERALRSQESGCKGHLFPGLQRARGAARRRVERAAARVAFEELSERCRKKYGAIVRLWENAWEDFIPFLSYDERDPYRDLLDQRH